MPLTTASPSAALANCGATSTITATAPINARIALRSGMGRACVTAADESLGVCPLISATSPAARATVLTRKARLDVATYVPASTSDQTPTPM